MQMTKIGILFFFLSIVGNQAVAENKKEYRLKDGRQYVMDLVRIFELTHYDFRPLFRELRPNLPRTGDLNEFMAAKDSMGKLASFACEIMDDFEVYDNIDDTYKAILNRHPTEHEKKNMIVTNGKFDFFATCFYLTMHPEFILIEK